MKIKTYKKELDYSYTLGMYATTDLLLNNKENVLKVAYNKKFASSDNYSKIKKLLENTKIDFLEDEKLVEKLSKRDNTDIVGIFKKEFSDLEKDSPHILLYQISDVGNLGTIIRSAFAFGINNIGIIKPAVDIFNPNVIRSSVGNYFHVNLQYFDSFEDYRKQFDDRNIFLFDIKAEKDIYATDYGANKKMTLLFGSEGEGIPNSIINDSEINKIKIYHDEKVESLNLATSVSIVASWIYSKKN